MNKRNIINITYILLESLLYILIFTNPFGLERIYSYSAIVLNFIYALTFIQEFKGKKQLFLYLALFTTLIADYFLVLINGSKNIAMTSFMFTQISYCLLILEYSKTKKWDLIIRGIGTVLSAIITFIVLKDKTDYLSVISVMYFFNLILNIIYSFIKTPHLTLKLGLVLFILCDILIGFEVAAEGYLNISEQSFIYKITHLGFNLAWVFYLPSQVLLALTFNFISNKKEAQ